MRPVLVRGSTFVKTSLVGNLCTSGTVRYLNELHGPWGWRNCIETSESSDSTWRTHPNHQFCSCKQVTNPEIFSGGISLSTELEVTLIFFEIVEAEKDFTTTVSEEVGTNECSLRVPGLV